jgi:hypothetical protein
LICQNSSILVQLLYIIHCFITDVPNITYKPLLFYTRGTDRLKSGVSVVSHICRFSILFIFLIGLLMLPVMATDVVTVARYASEDNKPEFEESYTIVWMEENLPVMGDGKTHYYLQGPVFDESEDPWNPDEDINCYPNKDMGAVRGTDVAALCDLAGGAHKGDVILIRSEDGFRKSFPYENVYTPPSCQGRMVLAWERDGQKAGAGYNDGIRLQFFADTSVNQWGKHIFGNSDMRSALPKEYWHFFQPGLPTTTGLSIQSVSRIEIYESTGGQPPVIPSGGSDDGRDVWTPATGILTVLSSPADATVVIDGAVSEFKTNVSIPEMSEGYYGITVEREGYEIPAEKWLMVSDGSNATVSFSLTSITAPCTVVSHPAGATVAVDGTYSGIASETEPLTLITGDHIITFTMDGYVPLEIPVHITKEGDNRVEGMLIPLCSEEDVLSLTAGPRGLISGSLLLAAAPGYPGFIAGGQSVPVILPNAKGEEITSYLLFSHGYDTASARPAEPQSVISSGGERLIPRHLTNALAPAGTVDQTYALFPSPSDTLMLSGAGRAEDVFSLAAVVSLCALPGPDAFSYAVYEGCVPAEGEILSVPLDTLPKNGIQTLTLLCTGAEPDNLSISVNGMPLEEEYSVLVPGLMRIIVPLPPGGGAYTVTAADAPPGCMVRVVVVTATTESSAASGGVETTNGADKIGDADNGILASIFRFFSSLFFSPATGTPTATGGDEFSLPTAGNQSGVTPTPVSSIPTPEMTSAYVAPAEHVTEGDSPTLTGGILLRSVPSGAWIILDGKSTGKMTPALFAGLKEGAHRISVSSPLFDDSRSSMVWVYPGALIPASFDFFSNLPEASIQVKSTTDEPVVFAVNGILPKQTTPAAVTITDTNSFVVVTSESGFQTYPLEYRREGGTLSLVPAPSGSCVVSVTSDPAGAEIFFDGIRTGKITPSEISGISPGSHLIACSLVGYNPDARVISVNDHPGDVDAEAKFILTPYSNGDLCVTSKPAGAKIYLYGRYTGLVTPATIHGLPIGTYEICLSSGDGTMVRAATVLPDTVVTYEFRLSDE